MKRTATALLVLAFVAGLPAGLAAQEEDNLPRWGAEAEPVEVDAIDGPVHGFDLMFAVVARNGVLVRRTGATAVFKEAVPGTYRVAFNRPVRRCAFNGTIGLPGHVGIEREGHIAVVSANVNAKQVFVTTTNAAGVREDRGFHLIVFCSY